MLPGGEKAKEVWPDGPGEGGELEGVVLKGEGERGMAIGDGVSWYVLVLSSLGPVFVSWNSALFFPICVQRIYHFNRTSRRRARPAFSACRSFSFQSYPRNAFDRPSPPHQRRAFLVPELVHYLATYTGYS